MPLGEGRAWSGHADRRDSTPAASAGSHLSSREEQQRRRQQQKASAADQTHNSPVGPSPLGSGRGSTASLRAPPPPAAAATEAAFPLNPHHSYDEEWGTMPGAGGHDSDSDTFPTPHALPEADNGGARSSPGQQAIHNRPAGPEPHAGHKSCRNARLDGNASASQPQLQPHRPPQDTPSARLEGAYSSSASMASPSAPPCTPERPHPSTADKLGSPQTAQAQLYRRSPSTLLSRASARIKVALEASDAIAKGAPADPPPRQPGLPPSSGHRRTYSHQVASMPNRHFLHLYPMAGSSNFFA